MFLRTLWRYRRPVWRWGLFIGVIAAVTVGLYRVQLPEPRWVHAEPASRVFDAGRGQIAVYATPEGTYGAGPLRLLDAATGQEMGRFLSDLTAFGTIGQSDDRRFFVSLAHDGKTDRFAIRGVDLHERREWHALVDVEGYHSATFAPRCDFVALRLPPREDTSECYVVVDTATGRVAARLHLPCAADFLAFGDDGGRLVVGYRDEEDTGNIIACSTRTGGKTAFDDAHVLAVAPDSSYVIADRGADGIWVGDLATASWRCRLAGAQRPPRQEIHVWDYRLNGSATYLALSLSGVKHRYRSARIGAYRQLLSAHIGRALWRVHGAEQSPLISPDARFVLWSDGRASAEAQLSLYDAQTGKSAWQRSWAHTPRDPMFTPESRRIVVMPDDGQIEVQSTATGQTEHTIAVPGMSGVQTQLTRDGRTLLAIGTPPEEEPHWLVAKFLEWMPAGPNVAPLVLGAFDVETGEPLGRLGTAETDTYWLTEDRRSLVTVYPANADTLALHYFADTEAGGTIVTCWDMPPHTPLRWVVSVPLLLATLLLSLRFAWRRRSAWYTRLRKGRAGKVSDREAGVVEPR